MDLLVLFLVPAFIVFGFLMWRWSVDRSDLRVEEWAARCGYRIIEKKRPWFRFGPFWWRTSKGQVVYRVVIEDQEGSVRTAWLRCGSWPLGMLSDDITVEWEQ